MKKIATLMASVVLVTGLSGAAMAHPSNSPLSNNGSAVQYRNGYHGGYNYRGNGYHQGWQHHRGYYRHGHYYGYDDDDGDNAWAGVLPGVVFGTILGSALSR